jgi:hypothetical protein
MLRYNIKTGVNKIKTKTALVISAAVLTTSGMGLALVLPLGAHAAGHPNVDNDCSDTVIDPTTNQTGSRADLYGCKPIGNSGDEQGIYNLTDQSATSLGYDFGDSVTCNVLVKWSGNYGGTPYLDYGTVFNNTKCSNGYVEIWGDNFNDVPTNSNPS